jgi:hypothetical protein
MTSVTNRVSGWLPIFDGVVAGRESKAIDKAIHWRTHWTLLLRGADIFPPYKACVFSADVYATSTLDAEEAIISTGRVPGLRPTSEWLLPR